MSYLNPPRLHFAGKFQADPSTVNNDPEHFDSGNFRSNYDLPGPLTTNGWWNPKGTGAWRFFDCTVRRAVYSDGNNTEDANVDPVIGCAINDSDSRVEGKLVDLDPEQQTVSQIWGFQVRLSRATPAGIPPTPMGFHSNFDMAPFADLWVRYPAGQPDSFFSAFYQSTLSKVVWAGAGGSRLLSELQAGGATLSIRFTVDGYDDDRTSPTFTLGRVVGIIGLCQPGEPRHFLAARALMAAPGAPFPANSAYAQVTGPNLLVDLGNSIPTSSPGGPPLPMVQPGTTSPARLYVAAQPQSGPPVILGEVPYLEPGWYESTSGIMTLPLTADQAKLLQSTPLALLASVPGGMSPLLAEQTPFVRADQFVFRFHPTKKQTDTQNTTLYATNYGQPHANQQISMGYDASNMAGQATQGPVPGPQVVGQPQSALTFPSSVTTNASGTADLSLTASDPGSPRYYIDGQVYGVTYGLGPQAPPVGSIQNPSQFLNALVFSGYEIPDEPTWMEDVKPILQQYANLYPVMRPIVDLANYASVLSRRRILKNVFSAPVTDPNYMPVTRDLSNSKRDMLLKWLDYPLYMRLDSRADLIQALQTAIELEHATLPPYLCGLYSIKEGTNVEIAQLIRSVVMEEMLHMAQVCNILISLGTPESPTGPQIGRAGFVPNYPGPLPGGLRADLIVRLRRCSIEQIRDVFMSIELPISTADLKRRKADLRDPNTTHAFGIGWFYDEIKKALIDLSQSGEIAFGNQNRQVSTWHDTGKLYVISNLQDALKAIEEIKEQGEGIGPDNPDDPENELAHYYKFAEIVAGRKLVIDPATKSFSYTGAPIPLDPDGVWPMMDDPDMVLYPKGSRARILSEQFAKTYQALLKGLHRTFNGEPDYLPSAIGLMYSLDLAARELMRTPSGLNDGTTAGPCFQLTVPGMA